MVVLMLSHRAFLGAFTYERRNGGIVGTLLALEANGSQEDSVVRLSEPSKVLRAEGPRHTPVQQSRNSLGP